MDLWITRAKKGLNPKMVQSLILSTVLCHKNQTIFTESRRRWWRLWRTTPRPGARVLPCWGSFHRCSFSFFFSLSLSLFLFFFSLSLSSAAVPLLPRPCRPPLVLTARDRHSLLLLLLLLLLLFRWYRNRLAIAHHPPPPSSFVCHFLFRRLHLPHSPATKRAGRAIVDEMLDSFVVCFGFFFCGP